MSTKIVVVRGTISRISKNHVGIYVKKEDQRKIENMIGKKIEAVLFIEEGGENENK